MIIIFYHSIYFDLFIYIVAIFFLHNFFFICTKNLFTKKTSNFFIFEIILSYLWEKANHTNTDTQTESDSFFVCLFWLSSLHNFYKNHQLVIIGHIVLFFVFYSLIDLSIVVICYLMLILFLFFFKKPKHNDFHWNFSLFVSCFFLILPFPTI